MGFPILPQILWLRYARPAERAGISRAASHIRRAIYCHRAVPIYRTSQYHLVRFSTFHMGLACHVKAGVLRHLRCRMSSASYVGAVYNPPGHQPDPTVQKTENQRLVVQKNSP